MKLQWKITDFNSLSTTELYQVLNLREEVFIIEQNCIYPDIDFKDPKAKHILGFYNNELVAYARIFKPNDYFENASIGRVVVKEKFRKNKFGYELVQNAINAIEAEFNEFKITISAQLYLEKFYNSLGFISEGDTYLEDNIPHIKMNYKKAITSN